jgi:hypothetical protein
MKEIEFGRSCIARRRDEEYIQNFSQKPGKKRPHAQTGG